MKIKSAIVLGLLGMLGLGGSNAHASLIGDTVHARYLDPALSDVLADSLSVTITGGNVLNLDRDISITFNASSIIVTNKTPGHYAVHPFNGIDIALIGGTPFPSFVIDPSSTPAFATGSILVSGPSDILLNLSGTCVSCVGGEHITLDAASAVPEPSTWAMMLLGFAGLGLMAYRRKSKPVLMAA